MEIFKILGTVALGGIEEANSDIDGMTGKAESASDKIGKAFKAIGTAIVTYISVDVIKNFGQACLDAAANAQAMESQFSQVFGDLEAQASKDLAEIAKSAGAMENRMKGSYTQIAAFAKSSGMDTAESLDVANRAMIAAADSAAFYDRSLEDTTDSLLSFLKGNFANDAALGLSCTEATRNAAAMELFRKEYIDLSEEQKQLTLLKMVEDANKLTGAMGQAAREADTWTNQTGNLQQSFTDLKAEIGKYLLPTAISLVKKFTEFVNTAQTKVAPIVETLSAKFKVLKEWLSDIGEYTIEAFQPAFENIADIFGTVQEALQPYIDTLTEYIETGEASEDVTNIIKTVIGYLADKVEFVTGLFSQFTPYVMFFINSIVESLPRIQTVFKNVSDKIKETLSKVLSPVFDTFKSMVGDTSLTTEEAFAQIESFVDSAFSAIEEKWELVGEPVFDAVQSVLTTVAEYFAEKMPEIKDFVSTAFSDIEDLWEDNLKPCFEAIMSFVNEYLVPAFQTAFEVIIKPVVDAAFQGIKSAWENVLKPAFTGITDFLTGVFTGNWSQAWDGLVGIITAAFKGIETAIEVPCNAAIGIANETIKNIAEALGQEYTTIALLGDESRKTTTYHGDGSYTERYYNDKGNLVTKSYSENGTFTGGGGGSKSSQTHGTRETKSTTKTSTFGSIMSSINNALKFSFMADGGTTATAGEVIVGEDGAELINLPAGATVTPLNDNNNALVSFIRVQEETNELLRAILEKESVVAMDGRTVGRVLSPIINQRLAWGE